MVRGVDRCPQTPIKLIDKLIRLLGRFNPEFR